MSDPAPGTSSSQRIQTYVLLSKSVKGPANCQLIMDVLAAPGIYVFSELYEAPNVVEASVLPEVAPYYELLKIFLYGTYRDYVAHAHKLPSLNPAQVAKLKHLSIISLSESNSRSLSYDLLLEYLDISNVRALEDLIIDAFYQGVLVGKLDQRQKRVEISYAMGRDLRPEQMEATLDILHTWSRDTEMLLKAIDTKIQTVSNVVAVNQARRDEYDQKVDQLRKEIRAKNKADMDTDDGKGKYLGTVRYDSPEYNERGSRAKKR
ncbi:uncharacterized protein BYT42DRAFT_584754 [Radiomyces spectabilis]|uniref:uncharacterized protein n=1 Tax=Radiomyces spectabilis TaxID=64574 RepID=UPI0022202417|nr:uncharacterized protein BYT42DRAFT_584754 [Radiomyces spectabilis]KAI8369524.1 hypothetical protein BYT42DRAFT_584754 [Radiomyces spectabilis]